MHDCFYVHRQSAPIHKHYNDQRLTSGVCIRGTADTLTLLFLRTTYDPQEQCWVNLAATTLKVRNDVVTQRVATEDETLHLVPADAVSVVPYDTVDPVEHKSEHASD